MTSLHVYTKICAELLCNIVVNIIMLYIHAHLVLGYLVIMCFTVTCTLILYMYYGSGGPQATGLHSYVLHASDVVSMLNQTLESQRRCCIVWKAFIKDISALNKR